MAAQDLLDPDQNIDADVAMAALIRALADEDAGVRARAAESLSLVIYFLRITPRNPPITAESLKSRIDLAVRGLIPLLSDRDSGVRAAAASALGTLARRSKSGQPTAEQRAALKDRSNDVRRQAAQVLFGDPDVTLAPELVAALKDDSAAVRSAAARALADLARISTRRSRPSWQ